jgi:hypothetical protein
VTVTETFQEVCDRVSEASAQNPYAEEQNGWAVAPVDPEQCAKYHAYEGYLDNVRESPVFYVGWTAEDLAAGAESNADSDWTAYL